MPCHDKSMLGQILLLLLEFNKKEHHSLEFATYMMLSDFFFST